MSGLAMWIHVSMVNVMAWLFGKKYSDLHCLVVNGLNLICQLLNETYKGRRSKSISLLEE
jgi:hypothetical protein